MEEYDDDLSYDLPDGAVGCRGGRRRRLRTPQIIKIEADVGQPLHREVYNWPTNRGYDRFGARERANQSQRRINMEAKKEPMTAVLPNPFALKSNKNHRYLNCVACANINKKGILQFCEEYCDPNFRTENAQTPGCVHIKHVASGKYLKRAENQDGRPLMIVATANTPNEDTHDEGCTLFKPEDVGPNIPPIKVICRIVHVQSGLYIRPYNVQGEDSILCAMNADADPSPVDLFSASGSPFSLWYI